MALSPAPQQALQAVTHTQACCCDERSLYNCHVSSAADRVGSQPVRELWTSQEDRAGLLIFLGLSFLCGPMEKVQARGPTDLDLEFASVVHHCEMRDECPCFSKLNALLQNGPKWHIIRDSK